MEFNKEEGGYIDLWKEDKERKTQLARKVEEKEEEVKYTESKEEKAILEKEEKPNEESVNTKRDEKTLTSVWELLMHSRAHWEALVMALDHKKIPVTYTLN